MKNTPVFEYTECSRCGGSGNYSYNQISGTRCFRCNGAGLQLTKRGAAAAQYYKERTTIRAVEVQIGDRIMVDRARFTVAAISEPESFAYRILNDGTQEKIWHITFTSVDGNFYSEPVSGSVRKIPQGQEYDSMIAECLKYQDSLTKAGKPRKGIAA